MGSASWIGPHFPLPKSEWAGALADAYRNLVDNRGVTSSEADALLAALSILNRLNSAQG